MAGKSIANTIENDTARIKSLKKILMKRSEGLMSAEVRTLGSAKCFTGAQ